jgi:hypothetical protein
MLDALEKLAQGALAWSETIGEDRWYDGRELVALGKIDIGKFKDVESVDEADAAYIAAADPGTVLKMIAAIRAAKRVVYSNGFDAALPENISAAKVALAALEDSHE